MTLSVLQITTVAGETYMTLLLYYFRIVIEQVAEIARVSKVTLPCRSNSAWSQVQGKYEWRRRPAFLSDQPVETSGGENADASCCYLWMSGSVGWNERLDDGLREDLVFSSGTQFLEGMIDAYLCLSALSILARLWLCSCHTVDAACESFTLKL